MKKIKARAKQRLLQKKFLLRMDLRSPFHKAWRSTLRYQRQVTKLAKKRRASRKGKGLLGKEATLYIIDEASSVNVSELTKYAARIELHPVLHA